MSTIWWISGILTTIFEFYLFNDFMSNTLIKKEYLQKYKWIIYILAGIVLITINTFQIAFLDITTVFILYLLILLFLYENSVLEKVFYIVLFLFSLGGTEYVVRITCFAVFTRITSIGFILINVIGIFAAFVLEKTYLHFICKKYDKTYRKWFSAFLVLPVIYMFVLIAIVSKKFTINSNEFVLATIICYILLFANTVSFYLFERLIKTAYEGKEQSLYIQKLSMNEDYYKMIEKNNERQSIVLHDFKHHINTLLAMAQNNNSEILDYLLKLKPNYCEAKTIQYTNNNIVNLIISEKQTVAKEKGICFNVRVTPCNFMFLDFTVACSLFSNLLDNAIEAAEKCKANKFIELKIAQFNEHYVIVQIDNSFTQVSQGTQGLLTTKSDIAAHGYGLKQITNLIEKQGGVFTYEYGNNNFNVVVMLKCD